MRKVLLSFILICGICTITTAQNKAAVSKFSLGPVAGAGWTTISNVDNSIFKLGGNFGLAAVYSAAEHFGIGLDIKYSFEGAKSETNGVKSELNMDYVRIPLKAMYFFNSYGDKLRPKIFAGPSFGFLSSAKADKVDVKSSFKTFDLGLLLGAGLNYRLVDRTWFNVDVSYTNGLTNINNNTIANDPKNVNRNVLLNVGVNFGL